MENKNKILIFGAGYFGTQFVKALYKNWKIIVVDIKEDKLKKIKELFPDIETINGDASSILTWKKINFENIKHIVITVKDTDVSLEACRISKDVFNLDIPITVFLYNEENEEKFLDFENINIIKPANILVNSVISLIEKNYRIATNIGLGKGEIIEVKIMAKSHLVDRKLKYLRPSKWRIAAIYRNGQLIIPSGDETIRVGDSVVLIGDPKVLENLVNILLKGIPQFPLQFGTDVTLPVNEKFIDIINEVSYVIKNTRVNKVYVFPYKEDSNKIKALIENKFEKFEIKNYISNLNSLLNFKNNVAFLVFPFKNISFFEKWKLKTFFEKANKPFLVAKGYSSYKNIAVLLNSPDPAYTLEVGIEISRLLKVKLTTFYCIMPKELRTEEEERELENVNKIITDFENIYKTSMNFKILEGNPVKESLNYLRDFPSSLLVMSYKKRHISFLDPHSHYLITKKCKCSSFLIPVEETND